jgi:hypothetical protein
MRLGRLGSDASAAKDGMSMDERHDSEIYEPPILVEVGTFSEKTLSGLNPLNVDFTHRWFHG